MELPHAAYDSLVPHELLLEVYLDAVIEIRPEVLRIVVEFGIYSLVVSERVRRIILVGLREATNRKFVRFGFIGNLRRVPSRAIGH